MKSLLCRVFAPIFVVLALSQQAAGASTSETLLRDLVKVVDGKFVYDDLALCEFHFPNSVSPKFQIRSKAEAPSSGVISRDNFVATITQQEIIFGLAMAQGRPGLTPMDAVRALHCTPLASAIGTPDIELQITMTAEGMQIEVSDTASGKKSRAVQTWERPSQ